MEVLLETLRRIRRAPRNDCRLRDDDECEGDAHSEVRTFGTMTKHLFELLRYLEAQEVTHIEMESTGVNWKSVYNILEGYFTILANAQRKNVPGR